MDILDGNVLDPMDHHIQMHSILLLHLHLSCIRMAFLGLVELVAVVMQHPLPQEPATKMAELIQAAGQEEQIQVLDQAEAELLY